MRNRVKRLTDVRAGDLVPDDRNWRIHPEEQRRALKGIIESVGLVDAVLVREGDDGRLYLVDGHLRAGLDPDARIPALVTDLDEDEAGAVLATFDSVGSMAEADPDKLREAAQMVKDMQADLRNHLEELILEARGEWDDPEEPPAGNDVDPSIVKVRVSCLHSDRQEVVQVIKSALSTFERIEVE